MKIQTKKTAIHHSNARHHRLVIKNLESNLAGLIKAYGKPVGVLNIGIKASATLCALSKNI